MRRILLFLLVSIFTTLFMQAQPCREVIAYFPSWKWYNRGQLVNPFTIDYRRYTAINYAFFQPNLDGSISPFDPHADKTLLLGKISPSAPPSYARRKDFGKPAWHDGESSLVKRAHDRSVKVLISIGGWTMSDPFPYIAASEEKRKRFAHYCNEMVRVYGIDGIDIDWEYPGYAAHNGSSADKGNFTLLLETVRDSLDALERETYRKLLLSAAFGVATSRMAEIEWGKVKYLLDHVNLMTYDFYGSDFHQTNHHAPLFSPAKGLEGFDLHSAVHHLMDRHGVPAAKINIGLAFYGRSLKTKGSPDLHVASRRAPDSSTFPEDGGAPMFYNLLARQNLFNYHWDSLAQAPYLKGKRSLNTFVTFDDEKSIARKAGYILDHDLAGAIIWDITGDYVESRPGSGVVERTPLADALFDALCQVADASPVAVNYEPSGRLWAKLPQLWSPVSTLIKRKVQVGLSKESSKKGKPKSRKEKKSGKKDRKKMKGKVPERYFDGGW
jgi:chitinase